MSKAPATSNDADWQPLAELDAILLLSGESSAEEEAVKKSTAFQARKSTRFNMFIVDRGAYESSVCFLGARRLGYLDVAPWL